jgi:hypothetical protein
MFERSQQSKNRPGYAAGAFAAALLLTALAAIGCGPAEEVVCSGPAEHIVLVPSTSETDYDVSLEMVPEVSREVVRRVAGSCGRVTVGIQDGRPAANLVLHSMTLIPEDKKEFNPDSATDDLVEHGTEFTEKNLIDPLEESGKTGGSPFFSTLIKIGEEEITQGWPKATIVLIGDGLVVQRPPQGGEMIKFGVDPVSPQTLDSFVPLLKPLKGSCVILVGAGATSKLPEQSLRASQSLMQETLEKAGVAFVASRSPQLPPGC